MWKGRGLWLGLFILALLFGCANDSTQASLVCSPSSPISWSKDVEPLMLSRCATNDCHPANSSSQLRLATYEQITASSSDVNAQVTNKTMPRGSQLSAREILLITCWINQGMPKN